MLFVCSTQIYVPVRTRDSGSLCSEQSQRMNHSGTIPGTMEGGWCGPLLGSTFALFEHVLKNQFAYVLSTLSNQMVRPESIFPFTLTTKMNR